MLSMFLTEKLSYNRSIRTFICEDTLNSNPPFILCLNTSFVFTNYQPIQRNASYKRTVRIMHRYCIMQQGYNVSNTVYQYFSWLEFKWHNDLETRHPWIRIASACGLVDSDFTNDEFLGHYPIRMYHKLNMNWLLVLWQPFKKSVTAVRYFWFNWFSIGTWEYWRNRLGPVVEGNISLPSRLLRPNIYNDIWKRDN